MTRPSWIGYTLGGRYQIDSLLGQGGMSAVYRANDPNLRRPVAVKLIHSHLSTDAEFLRRFETEAAAVAQLRHPNIVQVYDFDRDGEVYYMVMEFVPGQTLQDRLKSLHAAGQRMPVQEAAAMMATVADAVAYAHGRGMIHRDLKPANVMLMSNGQPVLTDFGVAKILGAEQHTSTGAAIGTPMYMSPEQVQGLPQDGRTDIYSLGIILFEMATGKPPYEGDSAITIMLKHVNEPLPDMTRRGAEVPAALRAVVEKALAKRPEDRFQSAADLSSALRAVAEGRSELPLPGPPLRSGGDEATVRDDMPGQDDRTVIEATSPMLQPVRGGPRPPDTSGGPAPRPRDQGTIVVSPEPPGWGAPRPEPVSPPPLAQPPRRMPLGLVAGLAALLLVCLLAVAGLAVLGGPALFAALRGEATPNGGLTDAPATATSGLGQATLVVPTEAEPTEQEPTEAPTVTPTPEPTLEPTATPIPVPAGMALIPGGQFEMGNDGGDSAPVHVVTVGDFFLDQFEVSNARYLACVESGACTRPVSSNSFTRSGYFTNASFSQYPVVNVTWNQATAFCAAEGKRLPTEAEWEYAASSGQGFAYPWGDAFDPQRVPVSQGDTVSGGSFPSGANSFGVLDLSGNVLEWVADWYQSDYYTESPEENPQGPNAGSEKVMRGGSFGNPDPNAYLAARRYKRSPGGSDVDIGFRCAMDVP